MGISNSSKKQRSRRIGILTDNERNLLTKGSFTPKQRSEFLKFLLFRIEASAEDLQLIWEYTKKDEGFKQWSFANWIKLYNLGQAIHPRHYSELIPYNSGRIKFRVQKHSGQQRGTRLYWFDEKDQSYINYPSQSFPDHQLRGIKPKSVKSILKEALSVEDAYHSKNPLDPRIQNELVVPRKESLAQNIISIKRRTNEIKQRLNKTVF